MRIFSIVTLILLSIFTWSFTTLGYLKYKVEILIQLSDIVDNIALPYRLLKLEALPPDQKLLMPLRDVKKRTVGDTWGGARSEGRSHEGTDIFAKADTPVFSATYGYVIRAGNNNLGGNIVFVRGAGGRRYYYAHLNSIADGIKVGKEVTVDTVLGFVGNTGNAINTPPHLHFGMYEGREAINPYPLLTDR